MASYMLPLKNLHWLVGLGLVWLLSSSISATNVNVEGSVAWTFACKDIDALHPQTKVVLDGGKHKASVRRDGKFTLFNVPPGSYLLEVLARDHVFDPLRVDVLESSPRQSSASKSSSTSSPSPPPHAATGATNSNDDKLPSSSPTSEEPPQIEIQIRPAPPGTPFHPINSPHLHQQLFPLLPYPIVLNPRGQKIYVVAEKGFDIIEMFKNPMMMMMLIAGAMIFFLPKMLENMDPDLVKDMRERQDKMFNLQSSLQNGDFSALKAELLRPPPVQESSSAERERSSPSSSSRIHADGNPVTGTSPNTTNTPAPGSTLSHSPSGSGTKKGQATSGKKAGGKKKR